MADAGSHGDALIGIDVGTSSVRVIAFDPHGRRIGAAARPTPTRIVDTGWHAEIAIPSTRRGVAQSPLN